MFSTLLRQPSRSPSPSFADTLDPAIFENHPAFADLGIPSQGSRMSERVQEPDAVPVFLRNMETERMLEFLQELYTLGVQKYIALPQLVVVGDQNSGKSSVLQAITRLPFPIDDALCTRFSTEVSLRRSAGPETISAKIRTAANDPIRMRTPDSHDDEAVEVQHEADGNTESAVGEEVIHNLECANNPFGSSEFAVEFKRMLREAKNRIIGSNADPLYISKATLHITVEGPKQINLTIVDIPGLVAEGLPDYSTTRDLAKRYIENPRSIVLAVAQPIDPDTQAVFRMIQNIPDKENRVIGVITKCDRKQEGADNWVLEAIKNGRRSPHHLLQGWFGLRNRLAIEKDINDAERDRKEAELFSEGVWEALHLPTKLGIDHLRAALTKMHNDHIKKTIPEFIPEIAGKLEICDRNLAQLGKPRGTKAEQLSYLVQVASDFSKLSADSLDGYYQNLPSEHSAKLRKRVQESLETFESTMKAEFQKFLPNFSTTLLTSWDERQWRQSILESSLLSDIKKVIDENRGTEFKDEVNANVMKVLWKGKPEHWRNETTNLIEDIASHISQSLKIFVKETTTEEELQRRTIEWLSTLLPPALKSAEEEATRLLSEESKGTMWTLVPRRSERVGTWYEGFPKGMAASLIPRSPSGQPQPAAVEIEAKVKLWLARNKDIDAVLNTYVRLVAYYEVAMYRYIDNIGLQVVERHLLGPQSPLRIFTANYVLAMSENEPQLLKSIAGENQDKVDERAELTKEQTLLKTALTKARTYGY